MGFFSSLTKFAVSPITLAIDAATMGQVDASKNAFEMIDEVYGDRPIVRPIIQNVVSSRPSVKLPTLTPDEKFEQFRAKEQLLDEQIIAERRWGEIIVRWSTLRVYTYGGLGWTWTYRDPVNGSIFFTEGCP